MNVPLALLADAANTTPDGKLNVLGVFDRIRCLEFPARHPQMTLVLRFEAEPAEWEQTKRVEIKLIDDDGAAILELGTDLFVPRGDSGSPVQLVNILNLAGVAFERPGSYEFVVLVNGEPKGRARLAVQQQPDEANDTEMEDDA